VINTRVLVAIYQGGDKLEVRDAAIVADLEHLNEEARNRGKDRCLCRVGKTPLKTNQTLEL